MSEFCDIMFTSQAQQSLMINDWQQKKHRNEADVCKSTISKFRGNGRMQTKSKSSRHPHVYKQIQPVHLDPDRVNSTIVTRPLSLFQHETRLGVLSLLRTDFVKRIIFITFIASKKLRQTAKLSRFSMANKSINNFNHSTCNWVYVLRNIYIDIYT